MDQADHSPLGRSLYLSGPAGRVATWNRGSAAGSGGPSQQGMRGALAALMTPPQWQAFSPSLKARRPGRWQGAAGVAAAGGASRQFHVVLTALWRDGEHAVSFGAAYAPAGAGGEASDERERIARMPLNAMMNLLPGTFYVMDAAGKMIMWNTRVEQATQLNAGEVGGTLAFNLFPLDERGLVASRIREVFERDDEVVVEAGLQSRDGKVTPYLFTGTRFSVGGKFYLCGMGLDLTQRRKQEEQLRLRERALHASSNGILIVRCMPLAHVVEYVNRGFEKITGYSAADVLDRDFQEVCGFLAMPDFDAAERAQVRTALMERRETRATIRSLRKGGDVFWNDLTIAPVLDEHGVVTHFICVINDVTETQQRTSRLEHEINHDPLTGLANRTLMWDRLEQALHVAQRNKSLVAVVLVDLDKFKEINDTLGHEAGDEVLRVVARKMQSSVRDSDTVARLGGDEFVLILANQPSVRYTLRMIDRLRSDIATPVRIGGTDLRVESSMGVAVFPHDGRTADELVQSADTAMYHAKGQGRNDVHFFSHDMRATSEAKRKLQVDLLAAIDNQELFLSFQPKLCLSSERIIGAEALLRWRHPQRGILLPADFLGEAEENGLIVAIGNWVAHRVCLALQQLHRDGLGDQVISMNASFAQFRQRHYIRTLVEQIASCGTGLDQFELEISEADLLKNVELSQLLLADIARLGVRLTVDDFGAGMISLKNLQQSPVSCVKIYRACMRDIDSNNASARTARTIIGMGHLMDLDVVGGGVETAEQLAFLRANGCDRIQGNYVSEPVPLDAYRHLVVENRQRVLH